MARDSEKDPHYDEETENNLELSDYSNFNDHNNLDELELEYDQFKVEERYYPGISQNEIDKLSKNLDDLKIQTKITRRSLNSGLINDDDSNSYIPSFYEHTISFKDSYNHNFKEYFTLNSVGEYILSIFPILKWLPHYNYIWFIQDLIAGITIGCVLVPQSMSYARIATLAPQYGLYSSFIGAFIYSLFATSKDVCIGPVAVMSLQTAKVIANVLEKLPSDTEITASLIATTLALLCGIIATGVGILRLGFLVELISLNAVSGFMTGSAINIISGQVPSLMGFSSKLNTRASTYKVIINTLRHLPDTKLDAVFGLIPLVLLYIWKWWCGNMGPKLSERHFGRTKPKVNFYIQKFYFYAQACRNAIVIIVFTCISWSITRNVSSANREIKILGTVPSGLKDVGVFKVPNGLLKVIAPELPASIIVLLLEHIAIAKSFGRVNDYKINPDQELIAIGVSNLLGTFFNAYPATGSFSRSALKSKCNVKTPLSGIFSGACVLLALYCLTGAFYYIPYATLAAIIIHAVSDLVASYQTTWNLWKMSPTDCFSFVVTVFITVFSSIENGIYFAICWSCALLLLRVAFPAGKFLGRIEIVEVVNGTVINNPSVTTFEYDDDSSDIKCDSKFENLKNKIISSTKTSSNEFNSDKYKAELYNNINESEPVNSNLALNYYTKWVPFDHAYTKELNPNVTILAPPPGVIVYRLTDSFTYLNCSRHFNIIFDEIKRITKRGQVIQHLKKTDRPWNNPGPWEPPVFLANLLKKNSWFNKNKKKEDGEDIEEQVNTNNRLVDHRPLLKILCLDFSQVSQIDSTALQSLVDLRKSINKYADRQVEFHFAGIVSPWVKRGLKNMKFGDVNEQYSDKSIIAGHSSFHLARVQRNSEDSRNSENSFEDLESRRTFDIETVSGTNLPFFHIDVPDFSKWHI